MKRRYTGDRCASMIELRAAVDSEYIILRLYRELTAEVERLRKRGVSIDWTAATLTLRLDVIGEEP